MENNMRKWKLNEEKTLLTIHRWPNVPLEYWPNVGPTCWPNVGPTCWPNVGPTRWHQHVGPLTLALCRTNMLALRRADEQNYVGPTPFYDVGPTCTYYHGPTLAQHSLLSGMSTLFLLNVKYTALNNEGCWYSWRWWWKKIDDLT